MKDFLKRLVIVGIMAIFISLLFIGGKQPQASGLDLKDRTSHWIWPTDGVVSDTYGTRNGNHNGIDIAGEYRSPVYAVDAGVITKSYYSGSYGNVVFIKHENGLETVYAHLGERLVEEGQSIEQGEVIGKMGSTGHSSGVHLHFEVHEDSWTVHKENALNPGYVFENVAVGETVQAIVSEQGEAIGIAESSESTIGVKGVSTETPSAEKEMEDDDEWKKNKEEEPVGILEAVANASTYDEMKFLLYSDYILLKGGEVVGSSYHFVNTTSENDRFAKDANKERTKEVVHKVQKGENLWEIAKKYNTAFTRIMERNNLSSVLIHPEQSLIVEIELQDQYVVQSGDNLTLIAKKMHKSVDEIKALNQLTSDLIHPQQVLRISD